MERLFGTIPAVLSTLGANQSIDEAVVIAAWKRTAGDLLRARTAPLEFYENRLVVAVADETWARHLEDLSPQMLATLNGSLGQGTVKFIEFRIDPKAINGSRSLTKPRPNTAIFDVTPSLAAAAESIADTELREHFLSAAATYLAKQTGREIVKK